MERYVKFDVEQFLRDSRTWAKEKAKLQEDLDNLLELPGIQNGEGHSSNISDSTYMGASKRLPITSKIDRLDHYEKLLEHGLSHISEFDRQIIEDFYITPGKYINEVVDEYCTKSGCSPRTVYRMKREAVKNFSKTLGF